MTLKKIIPRNPLVWLYAGGILLLLAAAWLWFFKISIDPERVFWGTVERSMATHGVTVTSEQTGNGVASRQVVRFSLGANNMSHLAISLSQGDIAIDREIISTPKEGYLRYLDLTGQKKEDGSDADYSSILGAWIEDQSSVQLFSQAALGTALPAGGLIMPIAYLQPEPRASLMEQIRDDVVYNVDFSKTKKERVNGRLQYTYHATVQPVAYMALMKSYAKSIGLRDFDRLNPAAYKGQSPRTMEITVDARARQLVAVKSVDTGAMQTYSGHDVPVQESIPGGAMTGEELQRRLQDLQ